MLSLHRSTSFTILYSSSVLFECFFAILFAYADAARTRITENTCHLRKLHGHKENTAAVLLAVCVCCGRCLAMDLHVAIISSSAERKPAWKYLSQPPLSRLIMALLDGWTIIHSYMDTGRRQSNYHSFIFAVGAWKHKFPNQTFSQSQYFLRILRIWESKNSLFQN
jgi:hypothetical protein